MRTYWLGLLILCLALSGCGADDAPPAPGSQANPVYAKFAEGFPATPRQRILDLLGPFAHITTLPPHADLQTLPRHATVLVFGDTGDAAQFIAQPPLPDTAEAFAIHPVTLPNHVSAIFAVGNPGGAKKLTPGTHNIGDLYAAYALLEQLGFAFLHPLDPTRPQALNWGAVHPQQESPHWPIRGWHIHTQHPLELTHVLNGWGPDGPEDAAGWADLLPEWERFLEWAIANRQNRVEWFLLMADSWQAFADSPERQARLRTLVNMAHQWDLAVGIDAPVVFRQQHAWTMVRTPGNEIEQIHHAIDWLHQAGFDYIEIEMGFSEFTHPDDQQMLDWMNAVAQYSWHRYGKRSYVKVHCTQDQTAEQFTDPRDGGPLNFNFLPYYADPLLGVMPHTVQYYDLQGPAYTYGNQSFAYMYEYLQLEAGRREVLYYPETAYWVSYDIDVPLFLPIYADRRLFDLRFIAQGEQNGAPMDGQVNFSSGWEWGYWLNDVITARAAWNPVLHQADHRSAFAEALHPITAPFGDAGPGIARVLQDWVDAQQRLFIHGEVNGERPADPVLRNAQAYLQGWEAWDDVAKFVGMLETQPRAMGPLDVNNPLIPRANKVDIATDILPLLAATAAELRDLLTQMQGLSPQVPTPAQVLYAELRDAMHITVLRAEQVQHLYATANLHTRAPDADHTAANLHLNAARRALDQAAELVSVREQHYRVDADRIASWHYNPTAYHFGYLWSVRRLHYWWRDEGKVVDRPTNPGYLNIMDPVDLANGETDWIEQGINLSRLRQGLSWLSPSNSWVNTLLFEPADEYQYPPNNLRERPQWYTPAP